MGYIVSDFASALLFIYVLVLIQLTPMERDSP